MASRAKGTDIAAFVKDLRKLEDGKVIIKKLTKEIRTEARPALKTVRQKIMAMPSQGENARRGRPLLRRSLQRATVMSVRSRKAAAITIKTDPKKMPEGLKGIPPYIEGEGRHRHPTFGHEPWVNQPPVPFFYGTLRPYEPKVQAAGSRAIEEIKKELEG
jgi:hypothetical protein